jgi:hypothetical protein
MAEGSKFMSKRMTATEYIMTIVMMFMLVCIAGAFFLGYSLGTDKTTDRYTAILDQINGASTEPAAYDQQLLVSFYHTIFSPYREYQKKWFDHLDKFSRPNASTDPASMMKELSRTARDKYNTILATSPPDHSPLLKEAHLNYLKSLKLFADTAGNYEAKANGMSTRDLLATIQAEPYFQEAIHFALQAQSQYYQSIVKWNESINPALLGVELAARNELEMKEWNSLNVNLKNVFVTNYLSTRKLHVNVYPQDLTLRVDEMVSGGQAKRMDLNEVGKIIDMLVSTGAVRQGDFIAGKERRYGDEFLPQLPFFFEF